MKPKPITRIYAWVCNARCAFAMSLWTDFVRTLEDTIRKESKFDGGNVWQVISEKPCHLSLSSATCPSFGADVEFYPPSQRIECLFRPGRNVRLFELRYWISSAAPREAGVVRIRPRQLAASLVDLTCFGGKEPSC